MLFPFQDVRLAAMECIERLYTLCSRGDFSSRKSGSVIFTAILVHMILL